jgi:plastocyanin
MKMKWVCLSLFAFILVAGCAEISSVKPEAGVDEITVKLTNFKITPSTIEVAQGQPVKLIVENVEGKHNLYIDGYNLRTDISIAKSTQIIEFTADSVGEFVTWCEVRDHRARRMEGRLFVK